MPTGRLSVQTHCARSVEHMTPQEQYETRIRELKAKYIGTLIERSERLVPIVSSLEDGTATGDMITQVRFDVHKIAGTAGTFALSELGELAVAANRHIDAGDTSSPEAIQTVQALMRQIHKAIAEAQRP